MDVPIDEILRIFQIIGILLAIITALVTGIRFVNRKLMSDVKEYMRTDLEEIKKHHNELETQVSAIKTLMDFFQRYLLGTQLKGDKEKDANR